MPRPLVDGVPDVSKNFEAFIKLRDSSDPDVVEQYRTFLKKAKVLVVEKINGKREYAPSRFVGYKNNSLRKQLADEDKNGNITTSKLEALYRPCLFDEDEDSRYVKFCKRHGVDKNVEGLNTSLKYIFSGFYTPSDRAIPMRAGKRARGAAAEADGPDESATTSDFLYTMPLNHILYGPPGTGKTYHTITRAVALLEQKTDEEMAAQYPPEKRAALRQKFEDYRQAQRIEFVTFHQAFSYEDFVEGIKPLPPNATGQVSYAVVDGVFKRICDRAQSLQPSADQESATSAVVPDANFDTLFEAMLTAFRLKLKRHETVELQTSSNRTLHIYDVSDKLIWFKHTDNKNHHISRKSLQHVYEQYELGEQESVEKSPYSRTAKLTLLQWLLKEKATRQKESPAVREHYDSKVTLPAFILIIDEINRGNVANIFGELITLLEDDKRAGGAEALTVTLPYSKEKFAVPSNLYVLGTMNTADRSVEALDTALRRRFSFTEMLPRPDLLPTDVAGVNLRELLTAINTRLEQLLDHDHCIGHAFLIHVKSLDQLQEAFRRSILPLLQEHFFGDWGKIGLVLGAAFIKQVNKKSGTTGYKLLPFGSYSTGELSEKPVYRLADMQQVPAEAFQAIYTV